MPTRNTAMHRASLAAALLAAAVSGCATRGEHGHASAITPTEQFAIEVRPEQDQIQLSARNGELSSAQIQALVGLAARWRDAGQGPVVVEAPAGAQNAAFAFSKATAVGRVLADHGVPPQAVVSTSYDAAGRSDAAVRVGFSRPVAVGPNCASFQSDFVATYENRPTANLGCATVANLAAQVANPNDLVAPREMTPADATRRGVVMGKYTAGQPTGTPRSANPKESANVQEAQK